MSQCTDNITMLQDVYQNASMGERGTKLLIDKTSDSRFLSKLEEYNKKYSKIKNDAADRLEKIGQAPRDFGAVQNSMLWLGVQFNTMIDKTPSHLAQMLIEGSTMGVVKGIKSEKRNDSADDETQELEKSLVKLEQEFIEEMENFLS